MPAAVTLLSQFPKSILVVKIQTPPPRPHQHPFCVWTQLGCGGLTSDARRIPLGALEQLCLSGVMVTFLSWRLDMVPLNLAFSLPLQFFLFFISSHLQIKNSSLTYRVALRSGHPVPLPFQA